MDIELRKVKGMIPVYNVKGKLLKLIPKRKPRNKHVDNIRRWDRTSFLAGDMIHDEY